MLFVITHTCVCTYLFSKSLVKWECSCVSWVDKNTGSIVFSCVWEDDLSEPSLAYSSRVFGDIKWPELPSIFKISFARKRILLKFFLHIFSYHKERNPTDFSVASVYKGSECVGFFVHFFGSPSFAIKFIETVPCSVPYLFFHIELNWPIKWKHFWCLHVIEDIFDDLKLTFDIL